jgi:serine/threonine-protein kinase
VKRSEADDRFLHQLQNEYDVSQKFRHHALRKAVDWKVPRRFFSNKFDEAALVLEWIDGTPLDQSAPRDPATLVPIFVQAGAALASMHRLQLVHCDFKPNNVLRCHGEKVKVIDFGQTCKIGYGKNRVQGTPDFIAPEQVKCLPVDERTDIYSFGASLYWALTGKKAPTYFTVEKARHDVVKFQEFPSPTELNGAIPAELSKLVMQCLMYNPQGRPAEMLEVLNALSSSLIAAPRA